jgi:hypothetical protein
MRVEAFVGRERVGVGGERPVAGAGDLRDRGALQKIVHRQRRPGTRMAAGRQHAVRSDQIVAEREHRVLAEQNLTGVLQPAEILQRLVAQHGQEA